MVTKYVKRHIGQKDAFLIVFKKEQLWKSSYFYEPLQFWYSDIH